ncbi:glutathione S-transferase C-terminal domain-containing protein homolog [Pollicipes pollicipes]|uniref:glutathione S-transferase C-terminal domain-containing protein homolog n=1 Tax=Pollicipes pollicipes TaxID=41117 RepID=UPI0018852939|nr:glutathione S-transferase C-terminal domain-containing protein homolog [Pollicipes pollicipes]
MIELCSRRRMLAVVVLLVCVSIVIVLLENILTPSIGRSRRLPAVSAAPLLTSNSSSPPPAPCWQRETFSITEQCRLCSDFEKASAIIPECANNLHIEVLKCERSGKAVRGCAEIGRLGERQFWLLEAAALGSALLSGAVVIVRQHQLERGALSKIQRQLASQVYGYVDGLGPLEEDGEVLSAYDGLQIYLPCLDDSGLVPVETAAGLFTLLLGFRRGTLAPPADASLWTRFCERDVPAAVRRVLVAVAPEAGVAGPVGDGPESDADRVDSEEVVPPAAIGPQTALVHADPISANAEPASAKSELVLANADPASVSTAPAPANTDSALPSIKSASASTDTASANTAPASANTHSALANTDPASANTGPASANTDPTSVIADLASLGTDPSGAQPFTVPPELLQFEHHMQQPLRVHNVWKQEQAFGGRARNWKSGDHRTSLQCVRHTYAEGHVLTISDLLLYPCVRVVQEALEPHGLRLEEAAPATLGWLRAVAAVAGLPDVWDATFPAGSARPPGPPLRLLLPRVPPQSLYKKDPARYKPKSRLFTVQSDVSAALDRLEAAQFGSRVAAHPGHGRLRLDWDALPAAASPAEGGLPATRLHRKQHQLENLAWLAVRAARPGDTLVDFCCGGGHLGLLLAVLLPACSVVLVENKEESLQRAQHRIAALGLTNVSLYQCNMEFYRGAFQLGVALHACGVATDLVVEHCLAAGAALLCCPCCYGAVHDFGPVRYPRSAAGRRTGAAPRDWLVLGHAADQTHADDSAKSQQGRVCMALVDSDRAAHLAEAGYRVLLTVAEPADCSNKNHLLVAVPPGWDGDASFLAGAAPPVGCQLGGDN